MTGTTNLTCEQALTFRNTGVYKAGECTVAAFVNSSQSTFIYRPFFVANTLSLFQLQPLSLPPSIRNALHIHIFCRCWCCLCCNSYHSWPSIPPQYFPYLLPFTIHTQIFFSTGCAAACLASADFGSCSQNDNACLCSSQPFIQSTTSCITSKCSGQDLANAEAYSQAICKSVVRTLCITRWTL